METLSLRIIDANANRAAEGLRVMEDIARFALNQAELAESCKRARHAVQQVVERLPGGRLGLLAARDTEGDVGTGITLPGSETRRSSLSHIAAAAGSRTTQALRMIEEACKLASPEAAGAVERVRYGVYTLDRQLGLALATGRASQWRLCVLITEGLCSGGHGWLEVARRAIAGGADCLQLREKGLGDAALLARARELVDLARATATPSGGRAAVIINDRVDVALLAGADGVHLGQGDLGVEQARTLAGDRLLIGVSTHDEAEVRAALRDGADYVGVGAMFSTTTKPRAVAGPEFLRTFLRLTAQTRPLPHLAIGGVTPENVGVLREAGCLGVAVSVAVCGSDDPEGVCRAIVAGFREGRS